VSTGKTGIKCPADGCTYRLSKLDVERLGAGSDVTRFQELLGADIAGKTRDLLADPVQAQWLRHNTKKVGSFPIVSIDHIAPVPRTCKDANNVPPASVARTCAVPDVQSAD
jgi:hypothetical protein